MIQVQVSLNLVKIINKMAKFTYFLEVKVKNKNGSCLDERK